MKARIPLTTLAVCLLVAALAGCADKSLPAATVRSSTSGASPSRLQRAQSERLRNEPVSWSDHSKRRPARPTVREGPLNAVEGRAFICPRFATLGKGRLIGFIRPMRLFRITWLLRHGLATTGNVLQVISRIRAGQAPGPDAAGRPVREPVFLPGARYKACRTGARAKKAAAIWCCEENWTWDTASDPRKVPHVGLAREIAINAKTLPFQSHWST